MDQLSNSPYVIANPGLFKRFLSISSDGVIYPTLGKALRGYQKGILVYYPQLKIYITHVSRDANKYTISGNSVPIIFKNGDRKFAIIYEPGPTIGQVITPIMNLYPGLTKLQYNTVRGIYLPDVEYQIITTLISLIDPAPSPSSPLVNQCQAKNIILKDATVPELINRLEELLKPRSVKLTISSIDN